MARPTAAAAGGLLACAVVLLLAGQSAAFLFPFTSTFPNIFPPTTYVAPPPVRIYSKANNGLNMAVRDGKVVLVKATYDYLDTSQLWWNISPPPSLFDGEGTKYWLINVATGLAMTSPPVNGPMQVTLQDFNPWNSLQLWVPIPPRFGDGGFYQIKPQSQRSKALNGLYGVYEGTQIGIYYDQPVSTNTLWVTSTAFPCPFY